MISYAKELDLLSERSLRSSLSIVLIVVQNDNDHTENPRERSMD